MQGLWVMPFAQLKIHINLTPLKQLLIAHCWLEALHNSIHSGLTQILYIIYFILVIKQAKEDKCY